MIDNDEPMVIAPIRRPKPNAKIWFTRDVADYIGVQTATVATYHSRGQMPAKNAKRDGRQGWKPATIIAWHAGRPAPGRGGHKRGVPFGPKAPNV